MKTKTFIFFIIVAISFAGCASAPTPLPLPVDYSDEPVLIMVRGPGIAPTGNGFFDALDFQILAGKVFTTEKWSLEIIDERGVAVRKVSGTGAVPSIWTWNGLADAKTKPADGRYKTRLSAWFPKAQEPIVRETAAFNYDTTGPKGEVAFPDGLFSPDGDGVNDTITIHVSVSDELSTVESWVLDIYDSHGASIKRFYSDREPGGTMTWDGMGSTGLAVDSASDYKAILSSRDTFGNESTDMATFSTDILVLKDGDKLRIWVNSITFKAYTSDYVGVEPDQRRSNLETLDLLASKLKKFPGYRITIEGHAVSVYWDNPAKAAVENRDILMPLSAARAEAIRNALQERGMDAKSMSILAIGSNRPIVPFSDLQNRWKNRRVEFILTK